MKNNIEMKTGNTFFLKDYMDNWTFHNYKQKFWLAQNLSADIYSILKYYWQKIFLSWINFFSPPE
jgi:hypothetical protein